MPKTKKIILIAGAPTVGKSTIARGLSAHYNIPWISTDQIREIMWGCANKDNYKHLFNTHNISAEEFYANNSPKEIVQKELDQAVDVWKGVAHFLKNDYTWKDGCIVEGVALLPSLIRTDFADTELEVLVLVDNNADRIRRVVFERGLWSGAKSYSDSVKEQEVAYIQLFNTWFEEEAKKFGYPILHLQKDETDLEKAISILSN